MNRREFIALTGAACFSIGHAATLPRAIGKGRRIRMALVGCGNRGVNNLLQEMAKEQVVAFADPNARNLEAALAKLRQLDPIVDMAKVKTFRDYREMFDKASGEIDAVVVAANNNHHALPALMAMRRGIHAYVEKPLAHTLEEIHALRDAAKRYGVVTQAGHQGHSAHGIRLAAEYMAAGAFGEVKEVWCWHGAMQARPSCPSRVAPHFESFCDAIREGKKASTDFAYGAPLADLTALVNVAQRAGSKKLLWDGSRVTNDAEANALVSMNYRNGWSIS